MQAWNPSGPPLAVCDEPGPWGASCSPCACDFCGARAAGFQALLLARSDNPKVRVYQDWLDAPPPDQNEVDLSTADPPS